ncbi:tyrosine-type recombinase/integrase [Bradyrhizobium sp. BR 1432]|uniref:tyrosine-type recombinase/integrase n=1 Tax=Bradyrhizobium sp. BR 1432 TaxID=3447966 RepID=UPI003EE58864
MEEPARNYWKAVLLCGGRRSEVANMHTREFEGGDWIVPADRYKTDVDHTVPLTPSLLELVERKPEGCKSKSWFVFSTTGGEVPISGFSKMKVALDKKINTIRKREGRKPMKHWQIRDLRRSCRTLMVSLGINETHAKAVTGHKMQGIDAVYNVHGYRDEKAAAIERFAAHIRSLLAPAPAPAPRSENVVAFAPRKQDRRRPSISA